MTENTIRGRQFQHQIAGRVRVRIRLISSAASNPFCGRNKLLCAGLRREFSRLATATCEMARFPSAALIIDKVTVSVKPP